MKMTQQENQTLQLNANRSMIKVLLLSLITCNTYGIVFLTKVAKDVNRIASPRDGKKTMHYCLVLFLLSPITLGIASLVWFHKISSRIGNEARARGIETSFGAKTFWLWNALGAFIIVGPFVYLYKLCKTMNDICADYNMRGC